MTLGLPEEIPAVEVGANLRPAGRWAAFISNYPFRVVAAGALLKSLLLEHLAQKPILWEPIFRLHYRVLYTSTALVGEIGASRARVVAATIQMVGTQEAQPCRYCRSTGGPFVHCVRDNDTPRCGNCHWRGDACSLSSEEGNGNTARR